MNSNRTDFETSLYMAETCGGGNEIADVAVPTGYH